jgi:hypothetical protein
MKRLILIAAVIIMAVTTYGQTFQKGNCFTVHIYSVTLAPDVSLDKYFDFIETRLFPEYEKYMPECKVYLAKGIKGECVNCYSLITVFQSEADMLKYFNWDGTGTDLTKANSARVKPLFDELAKLGKNIDRNTTWKIQ